MKLTMKIDNIVPSRRLVLLTAAVCIAIFAFGQNANATPHALPPSVSLSIGDAHELGFVNFGIPSGDDARTAYVNHLIGMALGTQDNALGQHFTRSNHAFSPLPTAVWAHNGTGTSVNLGAGGLYTYLFAKYDGPNYGSEVWYVGDLSGIITIPATAGRYGLSGWTLFGPGVPGVPDGGTTAMLLGTALGVLGIARRYIMS
jgi:VPDSG-CTERM motif